MGEFSFICFIRQTCKPIFFLHNYLIILSLFAGRTRKFKDDMRLKFLKFTLSLVEQKVWNFYVLYRILKQT